MENRLRKLDECGKYVASADDLLLIVEGWNRVEVDRKGSEWMGIMCEWGENICVKVSKGKTIVMLMKGSITVNRQLCVRMNEKTIKYVESAEYLGG